MIIFESVCWKNFLSTGNFPIEIRFDDAPLTAFAGPSGSGKSTLLDALSFGLFNKPFRAGLNKPGLINSINNADSLVEVRFRIGAKKYLVRRGQKPAIFEIHIDGELLNQEAHARDYQAVLERTILRLNFRTFAQMIVLGAGNFTPFMHLPAAQRRAIIEDLLDLQIFSQMNTVLKTWIADNQAKARVADSALALVAEKIRLHDEFQEGIKEETAGKVRDKLTEIVTLETKIHDLHQTIKLDEERIDRLGNQRKGEEQSKQNLKKLQEWCDDIDKKIARIEKELVFYRENAECPRCKQAIDPQFQASAVEEKARALEALRESLVQIQAKRDAVNVRAEKYVLICQKINETSQTLKLHRHTQKNYFDLVARLKREVAELEAPHELKFSTHDLDAERIKFEGSQEMLANEAGIFAAIASLLKDDGIKARIIKQYLPHINRYLNDFLHAMNFFVTFTLDENFSEQIHSRGRDEFTYGNFSEGERQRINLALLFTWRLIAKMKASVNTNLLIMDEIMDAHLGSTDAENVLEMLKGEMFKGTNVVVISHKDQIVEKFPNVVRFETRKNFAQVVEG